MEQRISDFGEVQRLEADAIGPPGRRAFRIIAESDRGRAWLRVERQQLEALAMLIEQLISGVYALDLRAMRGVNPAEPQTVDTEPSPTLEVRVGQMALGFDEEQHNYLLLVHDVESDTDGPPSFSCIASRQQLRSLAATIGPLVAGGRPRCPMCDAPLGADPHVCPRANGHAKYAADV